MYIPPRLTMWNWFSPITSLSKGLYQNDLRIFVLNHVLCIIQFPYKGEIKTLVKWNMLEKCKIKVCIFLFIFLTCTINQTCVWKPVCYQKSTQSPVK